MCLFARAYPSAGIPNRGIRTTAGLETENVAKKVLLKSLKYFYSVLQRNSNRSGMCEVALPTQSLASLRKALQYCIVQEMCREGFWGKKSASTLVFSQQH